MTSETEASELFTDASMIRRMHSEGVLLLGGGRALLMQIAHPSVAKGVAEHSGFQHNRLGRLLRTLRPVLAIAFGSRHQVAEAAASISRVHLRVSGAGYSATDPDLLLWVWATLVDTALEMHRLFVRPLSSEEGSAYYEDMKTFGLLLNVPSSHLPASSHDFADYVSRQCQALEVGDEARRIAEQIFRPWPPQWTVMSPMRGLTAGLMPEPLRVQFNLSWGPGRQRTLDALTAASRTLLPLTPRALRRTPWFLMPTRNASGAT